MFRPTCLAAITILALSSFSPQGHAAGGELSFNASGADGSHGGGNGEDAGDVTLHLSYADAAKTQVALTGQIVHHGRVVNINQSIALADLKRINISTFGGDGGNGYDGSDGHDGYSGRDGWDGCPPGDGTDGGDGGDGGNGGPGGNGGRGGVIHVTVDGSQSELLLFVKTQTSPGSAGSGGRGGSGGSGGRGGRGGDNTCKDAQGHPTHGPDGRNGRDGYNGRSGSSGYSGTSGRPGSQSFDVTDNGHTVSYPRPFALSLNGVKTLDENEDTILQPGEPLHLLELKLSNTGPMPTPTGQVLNLLLKNSTTLLVKTLPPISISEVLAGNSSRTLTFPKGTLVLQGVNSAKLIGEKAVISERVSINNVNLDTANESGFVFHWPVGVSAGTDGTRAYFGSAQKMDFSLHNVSSKNVGPGGVQPAEVEFSWVSANVPGADATVTLFDGRTFNLATPYSLSDFTIPAKSKLPLGLSVKVANTKNFLTANGKVKISVKLRNFASDGSDVVDLAQTGLFLALDLRPFAVNRHLDFVKKVSCNYPDRIDPAPLQSPVTSIDLFKDKGSDRMGIRYVMDGQKSPAFSVGAWDFAIYTDLIKSNNPNLVLSFLNNMLARETAKGDTYWHFSGCFMFGR